MFKAAYHKISKGKLPITDVIRVTVLSIALFDLRLWGEIYFMKNRLVCPGVNGLILKLFLPKKN
jgi:hypothetical protein